MISTSHINADYYFNRDVNCVKTFFKRRFGFEAAATPTLADDTSRGKTSLDEELRASGWSEACSEDFGKLMAMADGARGERDVGADAIDEEGSDAEEDDDDESDESDESDKGEDVPRSVRSTGAAAGDDCAAAIDAKAGDGDTVARGLSTSAHTTHADSMASGANEGSAIESHRNVELSAEEQRRAELSQLAELGAVALQRSTAPSAELTGGAAALTGGGSDRAGAPASQPASCSGDGQAASLAAAAGLVDLSEISTSPAQGGATDANGLVRPTMEGAPSERAPSERGGGSNRTQRSLDARDRVKQELRSKAGRQDGGKSSRNGSKDRDKRKLMNSVKREVSGTSGW